MTRTRLGIRILSYCLLLLSSPLFQTLKADESSLDLGVYAGRVVLVDFWASWCGPCRESFPWMKEMADRYGPDGLVILAVNLDEAKADAEAFLSRNTAKGIHILFDSAGASAERFGVSSMPFSLLFDRNGRPIYRHAGFRLEDTSEYEKQIRRLLADAEKLPALSLYSASRERIGVRPWEKGELSKPEMQLICDPLEAEFDDHVYFSKEASSGGRGFGGGGCGCN